MDLGQKEWKGVEWIHLAQDAYLVNMVMNFWVPHKMGNLTS